MRSFVASVVLSLISFPASSAELLLKNVNVVDVESEKITTSDVLLANGYIAKIGRAGSLLCKDCQSIDLKGKFLIPGLNDMHTHAYGNQAPDGIQDFYGVEKATQKMLAVGVTAFLDLFYPEKEILEARDSQRKGAFIGADIFAAGPIFTCTGGHGTEFGIPTRVINTPDEARKEIADLAKKSPDVVKIVYDNHPGGLPTLDYKTFKAAVEIAKALGLKTVIHINTWEDMKAALQLGVTAVTHTPSGPMPAEIFELFHKHGTYWIPTLIVQTGLAGIQRDKTILNDPLLKMVTAPATLDGYLDLEKYNPFAKAWLAMQQKEEKSFFENFRKLNSANIKIMTGTDIGNYGTFVGYSVHTELKLMVQNGMSPWQALAATTVTPGKFLGRNHSVRSGALANLIVLDKSPIDDINNTKSIHAVIWRGHWNPCVLGGLCGPQP